MAKAIVYEGKFKKLGITQQVQISFTINKKTNNPVYAISFEDKSRHTFIINHDTQMWEEPKLGVTSLSKKCGKIIEDYFS